MDLTGGFVGEMANRRASIERCEPLQTNVRWPFPVDQRLNELVTLLGRNGFESTRSLLLAALVADAPADAHELEELIRGYRRKKVGSVVLQRTGSVEFPDRAPGRRPR